MKLFLMPLLLKLWETNVVISIVRKKMIILEKQRSWGFIRQAHHNKILESGSSANFSHDDDDCWHDHACILFKDSTKLMVAVVTSVVKLKLSDTSCYPIEITTHMLKW